MTFHQLRIFKAAAEHLNVTRAARELHLSQPCVSTQLKLLKNEFGVEFYRKKGLGIKLTDEGLQFLKAIRPIVQQAEELKKLFADRSGRTKPVILEVGSTQYPSGFLLPEVLKAFRKSNPNINVVLRMAQSPTVEQMVLNREIEIGIVSNPSYNPNLSVESSCSEEVVAVVSPKHPLAKKCELTHKELDKVPAVVRMGGLIVRELQKAGFHLNISMECESSEALKAAVESGLGVGFFYRSTVETSLQNGHFKAIQIPSLKEIVLKSVVIHLKGRPLSPHAKEFLSLLRQQPTKSDKALKRRTAS